MKNRGKTRKRWGKDEREKAYEILSHDQNLNITKLGGVGVKAKRPNLWRELLWTDIRDFKS